MTDPNYPTQHRRIYLSPSCDTCASGGVERTWCQDAQEDCEECHAPWVAYDLARSGEDAYYYRRRTDHRLSEPGADAMVGGKRSYDPATKDPPPETQKVLAEWFYNKFDSIRSVGMARAYADDVLKLIGER